MTSAVEAEVDVDVAVDVDVDVDADAWTVACCLEVWHQDLNVTDGRNFLSACTLGGRNGPGLFCAGRAVPAGVGRLHIQNQMLCEDGGR
jgi:hypothetical protein